MGDIIIVTAIMTSVFLILRRQIRRFRKGECGGGCAGCSGSCCGCMGSRAEEAGKQSVPLKRTRD